LASAVPKKQINIIELKKHAKNLRVVILNPSLKSVEINSSIADRYLVGRLCASCEQVVVDNLVKK
jgi:hypothetical protein